MAINKDDFLYKISLALELDEAQAQKVKQIYENTLKEASKNAFKESAKSLAEGLGIQKITWNSIGEMIGSGIKSVIDSALEEFNNVVKYGYLTDENVRNLKFGYGFSSSEAYGYSKAEEITDLDIDNLAYATPEQQKDFYEYMTKYSKTYSQLYDSGFFRDYQKFQYEMEDFKQEISLELVKFFMENKDVIKAGMQALVEILKGIISISKILFEKFGNSSKSADVATANDVISNYSNKSINNSIKIDQSFNIGNSINQQSLNQVGTMTYASVIEAMKQGYR